MIFDMHGDIWTDVAVKRDKGLKDIIKNYHLERFNKGQMIGGIFVNWLDPPHDERPGERMLEIIRHMFAEIWQNQDIMKIVYNKKDFYKALEERKLAVILGLEGLSGIGQDIEWIYSLYQLGFRHMSLTWNEENLLATGARGDINRGLTPLGRQAIKIIEELGIILDLSHANDRSFWDIVDLARKPIMASHSNARSLCKVARNLTDDQIKAIGSSGGLVGINAFNEFIHEDQEKRNLDYLINHIEYMGDLIGLDHIGLGFDFFEYIDGDTSNSFTKDPYRGTRGIEDISQAPNLIEKLRQRGFSQEEIDKISYRNFVDFMERVL